MNLGTSRTWRVAVLLGAVVALSGCESLRQAAGMEKSAPDEFAVLTKAPLVVPPDYNLMPPRPGAPPTNQVEPGDAAETALYGDNPQAVAASMTGNFSEGEKLLLAHAGVASIDPAIRQHLAADRKNMVAASDSFTNDVLFWQGPKNPDAGTAVNADAEAKRLDAQKAGDKGGERPKQAAPKDDTGWFDGWFDWF